MPEQRLHGGQIRSPFDQVCGEAVAPISWRRSGF